MAKRPQCIAINGYLYIMCRNDAREHACQDDWHVNTRAVRDAAEKNGVRFTVLGRFFAEIKSFTALGVFKGGVRSFWRRPTATL